MGFWDAVASAGPYASYDIIRGVLVLLTFA